MTFDINSLLPLSPLKGPPLPQILDKYLPLKGLWPWVVTTPPVMQVGYVVINPTPSNATIILNGQNVSAGASTGLVQGTYTYSISASGYNTATGTVNVMIGQTTNINIGLSAISTPVTGSGYVEINTTPSSASIVLNGQNVTAGAPVTLSPGTYSYSISASGYNTATGTVTVVAGQMTIINVNLSTVSVSPTTGQVVIVATPASAIITLNNQIVSSGTPVSFSPGTYSYSISASGYNTATGTVNVIAGQTTNKSITLTAATSPDTGDVVINATPSGAAITLNDQTVTSGVSTILSPGTYNYSVSASGYTTATGTVTVVAGQTKTITVNLVSVVIPSQYDLEILDGYFDGGKVYLKIRNNAINPKTTTNSQVYVDAWFYLPGTAKVTPYVYQGTTYYVIDPTGQYNAAIGISNGSAEKSIGGIGTIFEFDPTFSRFVVWLATETGQDDIAYYGLLVDNGQPSYLIVNCVLVSNTGAITKTSGSGIKTNLLKIYPGTGFTGNAEYYDIGNLVQVTAVSG